MAKILCIIGATLVLALAACGGESSTGSVDEGAGGGPETFQLKTGAPPIRYASKMKPKANGLVGSEPSPVIPNSPPPDFLVVHDMIEGIGGGRYGSLGYSGDKVELQYVGYIYDTEKKFASSWDEGKPFVFTLGKGEVLEGWEQGLEGIEAGDRREIVVPPDLTTGGSRVAAPSTTLVYVIDALRVM